VPPPKLAELRDTMLILYRDIYGDARSPETPVLDALSPRVGCFATRSSG
jgi:hypothetical protein